MRKELRVASSDGLSSYAVVFAWDGSNLSVTCDCKAGSLGQGCRHKEGLINGDRSLLLGDEDIGDILGWIETSAVGRAALRLREAEVAVKSAQAEVKSAKKALADLVNPKLTR